MLPAVVRTKLRDKKFESQTREQSRGRKPTRRQEAGTEGISKPDNWASKQTLRSTCYSRVGGQVGHGCLLLHLANLTQVTSAPRSLFSTNNRFEWIILSLASHVPNLIATKVSAIHTSLSVITAIFLLSLILLHISCSNCLTQEIESEGIQGQSTGWTQFTGRFYLPPWCLNFF